MNKLLGKIERAWGEVDAFLASLSDAQKTSLTDADGWTIHNYVLTARESMQILVLFLAGGDSRRS